MKLFKTNNTDYVKYCKHCFSFDMPSDLWQKQVKFLRANFTKCTLVKFLFGKFLFICLLACSLYFF